MGKLEILAPVGSFKNLKLAINSGANAVYFGVKNFNARQKAENIDIEELKDFVELAHLYGVKTYLTLNTLIKNEEFNDVLKIVDRSIEAKVDAFIVQDIGLASYLINHYKNIELHASTQMGIHNLEGAIFLEKLGFKRVVLSRETKLEDIEAIRKNTNLEIEYFVQGALCVAFSGNCYFSSLCFNESGNRGKCLQPCRMCYEAFLDNKKVNQGYLLSTKDLCYIDKLKTLIDAGVTSFKIEGRLRREAYLIQSVSSYVKALTGDFDKQNEINKLKKVFSRGEYNYGNYLYGNENIIDTVNANHKGEKIGIVRNFYPFKDLFKIEIECDKKLNHGDGIKIINNGRELSLGVGNVEVLKNGNYIIYTKHTPIKGDVYLTLDSEFEKEIIPKDKKISINVNIVAKKNHPLEATVNSCDNVVNIESDWVCDEAKTQPISKGDFIEAFSRIKDTEFKIEKLNIDMDNIFIAKSSLNKFKNDCIIAIKNKILENVNKNAKKVIKVGDSDNNYEFNDRMVDYDGNFICLHKVVKNSNNINVFAPEIYNLANVKNFIEINNNEFIYLNLPIIATSKEIEIIDDILYKIGNDNIGVVVNNYWGLKYLQLGFKTIVGYNMNVLNNRSVDFYLKLGVVDFVRSIEGNLASGLKGGLSYEGYPTLMTWCHCPYKVSLNSTCNNCKFSNKLTYKLNDGKLFKIRRYKIINCYFELVSTKKIENKSSRKFIDII